MSAPPIVWIDERIAKGLTQDKDAELAERGIDQIRYVSQERVNDLVRAARGPDERIVQIQSLAGILYGLTDQGRLFAYGQPLDIQDKFEGVPPREPGWHEVAGAELQP